MALKLQIIREVKPIEVYNLVAGTGALSWEWWHRAGFYNGKTEVEDEAEMTEETILRLRADDPDSERIVGYTLTMQEIVNAAGVLLARGFGGSDASEMAGEDLGYADANMADNVLQQACFGRIVYG